MRHSAHHDPAIGQTIGGRYRVLRVLGKGGMGAVYEAEHAGTGRRVAVKVINAEMSTNAEMVLRFQREARAAGVIETPHIVQVLDTGTDEATGVVYMVMELLRGEDMAQLIKRLKHIAPLTALRIIGQACVGLGKAHASGVVHRDIKPANIFLSTGDDGVITVKVVDFGIAKIMVEPGSGDEAALTRTGGMLGSPLYMSPEQATGRKTIDQRTDVWSLGVVLYQALAGRVPHRGATLGDLIMMICSEAVPPIQGFAPWIAPEIADLVHRCLLPDPAARFPSMPALLEAIQQLAPGPLTVRAAELLAPSAAEVAHVAPRSTLAVTAGAGSASVATVPAGGAVTAPTGLSLSQDTPPPRSRLAPVLVAAAIAAGGLAAYATLGKKPAPSPASAPSATTAAPVTTVVVVAPAAEQVVKVAIDPADAKVEVDGRPAAVIDGSVEVRGVIGSAHHVRLASNGQETDAEVAITSLGAVPPKVQAAKAAPAAPTGKAAAGRSGKGRDQALDGKFE